MIYQQITCSAALLSGSSKPRKVAQEERGTGTQRGDRPGLQAPLPTS